MSLLFDHCVCRILIVMLDETQSSLLELILHRGITVDSYGDVYIPPRRQIHEIQCKKDRHKDRYIYRKKAQLKVCTPNVMCMFTLTTDACLLRKEPGSCFNQDLRFYWDGEVAECRPLMYSGCGGNGNNFATQDDCYAACGRAVTGTPSRRKNYAFDCFLG